jgi:K+-sensing histidine kinase KdpD
MLKNIKARNQNELGIHIHSDNRRIQLVCSKVWIFIVKEKSYTLQSIAYRLKASWYVCFVKDHLPLTVEEEMMLQKVISLTERLGGTFEMYEASKQREVVAVLVDKLNEKKATQVIIGQSARTRIEEIMKGSIVQKLLRLIRHLDV